MRFLVPVTVANPAYDKAKAEECRKRLAIYPVPEKIEAPPGTVFDDANNAARVVLVYMLRTGIAEPLDDDARECTPQFTEAKRKEALEQYDLISKGMHTGDPGFDADPEDEATEEIEYVESLGDLEDTALSGFDD